MSFVGGVPWEEATAEDFPEVQTEADAKAKAPLMAP